MWPSLGAAFSVAPVRLSVRASVPPIFSNRKDVEASNLVEI